MPMTKLIHADLTYTIRGILFDIHNQLGPMLPENIYQQAIVIGLEAEGIACQIEKPFEVFYRGGQVGLYYIDVWIEGGKLILELKVAPEIHSLHQAQAISYLKVTDADLAIVANFGAHQLETERLPNFLRDKSVVFDWQPRAGSEAIPYPELSNRVLEVCHRVHFELGPGFLHQVYRRATMIELEHQGLLYRYIKTMPLSYQGQSIGVHDVRLIAVDEKFLVATIAVRQIEPAMKQQLHARLKHLGFPWGLIINFHDTKLEIVTVSRLREDNIG